MTVLNEGNCQCIADQLCGTHNKIKLVVLSREYISLLDKFFRFPLHSFHYSATALPVLEFRDMLTSKMFT